MNRKDSAASCWESPAEASPKLLAPDSIPPVSHLPLKSSSFSKASSTHTHSNCNSAQPISAEDVAKFWQSFEGADPLPHETAIHYDALKRSDHYPNTSMAVGTLPPSECPDQSLPSIKTIPGTMSARHVPKEKQRSNGRFRSNGQPEHSKREHSEPVSFATRMKRGMKGLFVRDPMQDLQFEPIKDRHWTEDDY